MTIAFRTRLFVTAALIVAFVLGVVMILGWSSVLQVEVERLDDRLCMEARRLVTAPFRDRDAEMPRMEADMTARLRLDSPEHLMFCFDFAPGNPGFQSTLWPSAPDMSTLSWTPAPRDDGPGPPPGRGEGRPEGRPPPPRGPEAFDPPRPDRRPPGMCALSSFKIQGGQWRAARFTLPMGQSVVAVDLAATRAELRGAVRRALTVVIPLALGLSAVGAWLLASLTMRPVNRLREAMKAVTQKSLDQRLPNRGEDLEFKDLIAAYNTMLQRLETSFHQASRFSADAAHELKTPLTILQGRLEQEINRSGADGGEVDLTDMLDEVGRLSAITRKLLLLSLADAGKLALHMVQVDLTELLDGLLADAQMVAGDRDQTVSSEIGRDLTTQGDALLLRQLLNNLMSNALRHGREGGWIRISGRRDAAGVEIIFANASRPIPGEDRLRFFDRFYRGDPAHSREVEGSGLGLSLAREIARAHGGELTLETSRDDEVRLRLWFQVR